MKATEGSTVSGLRGTIAGFAEKYGEHRKSNSPEVLAKKLEFHFVTNRPIGKELTDAHPGRRERFDIQAPQGTRKTSRSNRAQQQ